MRSEQIARGKIEVKSVAIKSVRREFLHDIDRWIWETCNQFNRLDLISLIQWKFTNERGFQKRSSGGFNAGYTNCEWNGVGQVTGALIRLSESFWQTEEEQIRKRLIVHETCHVVAVAVYGPQASGMILFGNPHGSNWQKLMTHCGEESTPQICGPAKPLGWWDVLSRLIS